MRILFLGNHDLVIYRFKKELIASLLLNGNEVCICCPKGVYIDKLVETGCKFIDIKIDRRGINPLKDIKLLLAYNKIIKNIKPDLVLTYTIKPNIYGGMVCRYRKAPYFVNITGLGTAFYKENTTKRIIVNLYKLALKKVRIVFFENIENKNVFLKEKITEDKNMIVLNGAGVNLEDFPFVPLPDNDIISFLFIGRVMKEKGIDELLCVAKRCKEENLTITFTIIGGLEENYKDILEEYNNKEIISYCGFQQDVQSFIKNAHCIILPSYHEGMSNTLLEAAAMGRPLITSDIHGCKEAVIDGKTGYLCKAKDTESLYNCIKSFLVLSYKEKIQMGVAARKHIEDNFDKEKVVQKTIEAINLV